MSKHFLEMTKNEQKTAISFAKSFIRWTNEDIKDVTNSFFKIGFRLHEARACRYYEALGFPDIETLAEEEFGFKRSTTYGLIQVYEKTSRYGHCEILPQYDGYSYSQLLELIKNPFSPPDYHRYIKSTDSVRDIQAYIRYWKEYTRKTSTYPKETLQEWKAQQAQIKPALPAPTAPIKGQLSIVDPVPDKPQPNTNINNVAPTVEQPAETVQTFGLPTCAKTEEKTPKYNFSTRAGVREFLKDCLQWKEKECYSPFISCHYYMLKNKRRIYVYVQRTASKNSIDGIYEVIHRFFIDLNQYSNVPVEITKEQFEQYCAEHKDEL